MAERISQDGNTQENKYLYQGKELNQTEKLNIYDFHARQYDPLLGRFTAVDPAGQFASGYVGMANNPTTYVDPTGMVAISDAGKEAEWEINRQKLALKREYDFATKGVIDPWDPKRHEYKLLLMSGDGGVEEVETNIQAEAELSWLGQDGDNYEAELEFAILGLLDKHGIKLERLPDGITTEEKENLLAKLIEEDSEEVETTEEKMEVIVVTEEEMRKMELHDIEMKFALASNEGGEDDDKKKKSVSPVKKATGFALILSVSDGPAPVGEAVGLLLITGAAIYQYGPQIADASTEYINDFINWMAEHKKNARQSTKSKHQKGQTKKANDRNRRKPNMSPPRKRPPGWKGPWPPKNWPNN